MEAFLFVELALVQNLGVGAFDFAGEETDYAYDQYVEQAGLAPADAEDAYALVVAVQHQKVLVGRDKAVDKIDVQLLPVQLAAAVVPAEWVGSEDEDEAGNAVAAAYGVVAVGAVVVAFVNVDEIVVVKTY